MARLTARQTKTKRPEWQAGSSWNKTSVMQCSQPNRGTSASLNRRALLGLYPLKFVTVSFAPLDTFPLLREHVVRMLAGCIRRALASSAKSPITSSLAAKALKPRGRFDAVHG